MPTIEFDHGGKTYEADVAEGFLKQPEAAQRAQLEGRMRAGIPEAPAKTVKLQIEGIPGRVEVDAAFATMSADQQRQTVDDILAQYHGAGSTRSNTAQAKQDTSWGSAIDYGRANVQAGAQATNRVLGLGSADAETPAGPAGYDPASPKVIEGVRDGDVGKALGYLPRAAAENAPDLAGGVAAGAIGAGIGGVAGSIIPGAGTAAGMWLGGLAGSGLYSLYRSLGQNVEGRAESNGHIDARGRPQPTTGDYLIGGGTSLATSALDAVGARGLGRAAGVPLSALGRARLAATAAAREGATETAQSLVEQTGQSLGTEKGLSVDPAQALGEGLIGMGTGAGVEAGHAAARAPSAAGRAISDAVADRQMGGLTPQRAASVERVGRLIDEQMAATDRKVSPAVHLETVRSALDADLDGLVARASERGWTNETQTRDLRSLLATARREGEALATGDAQPGGRSIGLAKLDDMTDLPPEFRDTLAGLLQDRDTLSIASRPGLASRIMEGLAGLAGAATGGSVGHVMGPAGAMAGGWVGGQTGRALGRRAAAVAGGQPAVMRARRRAQEILEAEGIEPGEVGEIVQAMHSRLDDDAVAERMALGLAADEETMAQEAAQMAKTRASWTKRRVSAGMDVSEADLANLTERDRLDLLERMRFDNDRAGQAAGSSATADARRFDAETRASAAQRQQDEEAAWRQRDASQQQRDQVAAAHERAEAEAAQEKARQEAALAALVREQPAIGRALTRASILRGDPAPQTHAPVRDVETPAASPPSPAPTLADSPPDTSTLDHSGRPDGIFTSWRAGVMRFAAQHRGVVLAPRDVDAALTSLVERGEVGEDVAAAAQHGDRIGQRTLEKVTAEAIRGRFDPERPFAHLVSGGGGAPGAEAKPVRSPQQFRSAAEGFQASAARAADRAHAAGDFDLAALIESMAANSETVFPPAERLAEAATLIAADPEQRARREAALRPLLRRYRGGQTTPAE